MGYDISILNNLYINQIYDYLCVNVAGFETKYEEQVLDGEIKQRAIRRILNNYLDEDANASDIIESSLFDFLFSVYPETTMHYHMVVGDQNIDEVHRVISENPEFNEFIDNKLYNDLDDDEPIVSIRFAGNTLKILLQFGVYTTPVNRDRKRFLVACKLDFNNNILSFAYKQNVFSKLDSEMKFSELKNEIINTLNSLGLQIVFRDIPETAAKKAMYLLFTEESARALELIKQTISDNQGTPFEEQQYTESIRQFLTEELRLANPDEFINRAMILKYQDSAIEIDNRVFINHGGYIFGFSFVDPRITKSSNRSDDRDPVYKSKIFWNLKDVVSEYEELDGLSMFWRFNPDNFDDEITPANVTNTIFVLVDYKYARGSLCIYHYVNKELKVSNSRARERERAEEYVLYRIAGNLQ